MVSKLLGERTGRWDRRRFLMGFVATPLVLLVGCGAVVSTKSGAAPTANSGSIGATQTSDGGQVTVAVTWTGLTAGPIFSVVMNTHAVDLDGYDLLKLAVLTTNNGQSVQPMSWDAPSGGHHRQGTLTFPTKTADGAPLFGSSTSSVKLLIRDVAGVPERTFQWTLSS